MTTYPTGYEWHEPIFLKCPKCGIMKLNPDMKYNEEIHQFECKECWERRINEKSI